MSVALLLQNKFVCYIFDGIKFFDQNKLVNFNLNSEGVEILEGNSKQILLLPYSDITDVKITKEDNKDILNIHTNNNIIKIYKPVGSSVQVIKEMLIKCIENKDKFFTDYDKQMKEQEKLFAQFWNVVLWFIGIGALLSIFDIKDELLSSICTFSAGLLLVPPSYNFLKERFQQLESKKVRVWSIIILFMLSGFLSPTTITAYIKAPNTIICKEADSKTGFKKMNTLEEINVYKDSYKKNGFLKTDDGNWVKENSIVYANTQEYNEIKKAEEKQKQELEKAKQEIEKLLQKQEANLEKELKSRIDKAFVYYDINDYSYVYYANPIAWYSTNVKEKENIMRNCAEYGRLSRKQKDMSLEVALSSTKIKSSSNGAVLGEYSIWSGFKFQ